ncbi:MAG TPA: hypothetical protein VKF38_00990 [Anaerolineaceae bacterium]|nr:hypothetical protein [Anaerolineaceae bacterium]
MIAPVTHILPLTNIRRARRLPVPGRVLVKVGQKVNTTDIIADAPSNGQHYIVDVRRVLGIPRNEKVDQLIQRKPGERIQKGDVIAETSGMFSRVVRSQADGSVLMVGGGLVLIETQNPPFVLKAGFSGVVSEVLPERGVILETQGVLIQGAWGNNRVDQGVLLSLAHTPGEEFVRTQLDVSMRGAVVLAGYCFQADALQAAAELPLRGLILGSMSADLISLVNKLNFPVISLAGFGHMPIDSDVYKILTTNEKRDTSLNAAVWNPQTGDRPEVIIPLPSVGNVAPETDIFKPGQTVRIQGAPYNEFIGVLVQIKPGLSGLANGVRTPAALVQLENEEQVTIPLANLEVLE